MASSRAVNLSNFVQFAAINLTRDPGYDPVHRTIPNCVEVHLVWILQDAKLGRNVLHGIVAPAFAPSSTIANSIMTGLTSGASWTAYALLIMPTASLFAVELRDIRTANQPLVSSSISNVPGTSVGTDMPNEVAACVTERTAGAGKAFRGRIYLPGFSSTAMAVGNVVAAPAVTAINNFATLIQTTLTAQGIQLAIGQHARLAYNSPATGNPIALRNATAVPVTSLAMRDNHWDSQRRRGLK
jgi:hypothetical protein